MSAHNHQEDTMESQDKGFFYNAKESLVGILATLTACIVLGIIAARLFREGELACL